MAAASRHGFIALYGANKPIFLSCPARTPLIAATERRVDGPGDA
jgi:hypothetical protein